MNSLREHALSASAGHSAVLGNVSLEVGALRAEAVGLVHRQHASHVELQAEAQQRYHQLEVSGWFPWPALTSTKHHSPASRGSVIVRFSQSMIRRAHH